MRLKKLFSALSLLSLCTIGALASGGCADNRTTLFISHVAGFAPGDTCEVELSLTTAKILTNGRYNPIGGNPYYAWVVVANGLQPLGDNDTLKPETSRIQLQGAEISINGINGGAAFPAFTFNFAATISPDESEDPGLGVVPLPIFPASTGLGAGDYLVDIQVFGETLGGTDVESGPFTFPITVDPLSSVTCATVDQLAEEDVHPCGYLSQDGFAYPCGSDPDNPACISACAP